MYIDSPLFLLAITVGPTFLLAGFIQYKFPPKEINGLYGYRSKRSTQNIEQWTFAQTYSAKKMMLIGFIYLLLAVPAMLITLNAAFSLAAGLTLLLLSCYLLYRDVEKALANMHTK